MFLDYLMAVHISEHPTADSESSINNGVATSSIVRLSKQEYISRRALNLFALFYRLRKNKHMTIYVKWLCFHFVRSEVYRIIVVKDDCMAAFSFQQS